MRRKHFIFEPADASLTGFASNVTGAAWTLTATAATDGYAHQVSIRNDSGTDHSGKTATLSGTDADGKAQTESVTLPTAGATVESTKYFKTLTSVTPSATINADTMDIGWVDEFVSQTIPLGWRNGGIGLTVIVSGTINYTIENTNSDIQDSTATINWLDHDDSVFVSATASDNSNYDFPPVGTRVKVNSYSSGATLEYDIVQSDN